MSLIKTLKCGVAVIFSLYYTGAIAVQEAQNFAPPNQSFTDEFFVNLISGQVSPTLSTVSIGGDLGLSHSISIYANDFDGDNGYTDKFTGFIRSVEVGENILVDPNTVCQYFSVMRAHSPIATADFKVMRKVDNTVSCYPGADLSGGYYYEPLGDIRHKLEIINNGTKFKWTTENGTEIIFRRAENIADARAEGLIEKIIYPNGFAVTISAARVTTNTGYQLKYIHEGSAWYKVPRYIKAINNAVEPCSTALNDACNHLEHDWPTVEFIWPNNMPMTMMSGENIFKVIGPGGEETHYKYAAHDLSLQGELGEQVFVGSPVNRKISPRLVGIKPAYSDEFVYQYQYKNNFMLDKIETDLGSGIRAEYNWWNLKGESGIITKAFGPAGSAVYSIAKESGQYFYSQSVRSGRETMTVETNMHIPGSPNSSRISNKGAFGYLLGYSGFINQFRPVGGNVQYEYEYSRHNVIRIGFKDLNSGLIYKLSEIGYPPSGSCNSKTCNKPIWTSDANGAKTLYTYHAESGQVESITYPADRKGIAPQTRYTYEQKYATYYRDGESSLSRAETPIWLLTKESYCRTSASTANTPEGTCTKAGDEVITTYDYGSESDANNLQLRSITVTADGKARKTCFAYDIYGNKIGEKHPKGTSLDSNSCPTN